MLNRFYFPPTLPHSTHILFGAGPENQHMTSITKTTTPAHTKYSIEKKRCLIDFISHLPSRIPPTFVCGAGPENQHMTSINQERQLRPSQNMQKKKMLNRFYFPPTLPHSTHILLWRRTGEPTHDLHHQERQLRPTQNIQ
ncbi:hypothetical protein TNCV_456621 [Trichonephila clavipes]|uniref:Uncharacterized protein n=1 Tax=Trichonephila clavipes TaxID=2585209 RepID=A0A8X6V3E0_TRICX|nr:hypothetical protein TNCV_456621 [Trichonephila clavipes]